MDGRVPALAGQIAGGGNAPPDHNFRQPDVVRKVLAASSLRARHKMAFCTGEAARKTAP